MHNREALFFNKKRYYPTEKIGLSRMPGRNAPVSGIQIAGTEKQKPFPTA